MEFKFDVHLNDRDYFDYNKFWMIRSPYGKKQMIKFRVIISVLFCVVLLVSLMGGGFTADALLGTIPYCVVFVLVQLLFNSIFVWTLKGQLKALRKKGKMGYSPVSCMEFFEDSFREATPENSSEQRYSALERVSVIEGRVIYLHVNNVMAYLLPYGCFASEEQYSEFLAFIQTKCERIDSYPSSVLR